MFAPILQVAFGGAIGAVLRYLSGIAVLRLFGAGFPVGTLAVNVFGSFLMGVCFVYFTQNGGKSSPFIMTGILGGFTTFSAFSLEAFQLFDAGRIGAAGLYVALSVGLSLLALAVGILAARGILG